MVLTNNIEIKLFLSIKETNLIIEDLTIDIFEDVGIATFYNNYSFVKNHNRPKRFRLENRPTF